jgi:uncharacterized protein (TIGR03437 family)
MGTKPMKLRHFAALCGALFGIGASSFAQTASPVVFDSVPTRILGQPLRPTTMSETISPPTINPNLLEGRELNSPLSVAVDTSVSPPAVYVCDTYNNRVLAWKDGTNFANGAPADLVLGKKHFYGVPNGKFAAPDAPDRKAFAWSSPVTPTLPFPSALSMPTSVAVNANGDVFVMDAGNNRILRFPRPFDPANADQAADMVVGQNTRTGALPNRSSATTAANAPPNDNTLRTSASYLGGTQLAALAFDPQGNLWVTDSGNHRVLRYSKDDVNGPANIASSGTVEPDIHANLVLGQADFTSAVANPGLFAAPPKGQIAYRLRKDSIRGGDALAFDQSGNLYLSDDLGRVLFYRTPSANGQAADRILGLYEYYPAGSAVPPGVNDVGFGFQITATSSTTAVFSGGPHGLFCIGDSPFVVDTYNSRILRFDPPAQWPAEDPNAPSYSPHARVVIGHENFTSGAVNRYGSGFEPYVSIPGFVTFNQPSAVAVAGGEVWVADTGNNRVLVFPNLDSGDQSTARGILGQDREAIRAPDFIEGRELSNGTVAANVDNTLRTLAVWPAAAVDKRSDPPRLYIADPGNNRILCFADARKVVGGDYADIIIGQIQGDRSRALINSPTNDPLHPTQTGLYGPSAVAVDSDGNLWVADTGNGRVLRFPDPFKDWPKDQNPDLVLGVPDFTTHPAPEPSQNSLFWPVGLAFTSHGQLLVSDYWHSRVVRFDPPFVASGMNATVVVGQPDLTSGTAAADRQNLSGPRGIAVDTADRLYVADAGNKRVSIFDGINTLAENGPLASFLLDTSTKLLFQPQSVAVSPVTGDILVADSANISIKTGSTTTAYPGLVWHYPEYSKLVQALVLGLSVTVGFTPDYFPLSVALDGSDNMLVIDSANRLAAYAPLLKATNWASGMPLLAPGLIATIEFSGASGHTFSSTSVDAPPNSYPTQLGGLEVLVNGKAVPISHVEAQSLRVQLPNDLPTTGTSEYTVRRIDTGEILGTAWLANAPYSPAFIVTSPPGAGQIRALNADGTQNSSSNPAQRGSGMEMTLYLVGYGHLDDAPPAGTAAEVPVPFDGTIIIGVNTSGLAPAQVVSSTLDPSEPGVWKLRVRPDSSVTGASGSGYAVPVYIYWHSTYYVVTSGGKTVLTTVAIKP